MKSIKEIKKIATDAIKIQHDTIGSLFDRIDAEFFNVVSEILKSNGNLIITGIGKSADISRKLVSTFNSTGQTALFLHAADAIHGDLGIIQDNDIVICISKSGNTEEIKFLIPLIKNMGNTIIAFTGNNNSFLAKNSNFIIDVSVEKEACPNNLAPTSSTTAQLVMGDALAIVLLVCKDFSDDDFARYHPGGSLGKRLYLRLNDIVQKDNKPQVDIQSNVSSVILEISKKRFGATAVLEEGHVAGIITDGDLRRMLEEKESIKDISAINIMSKNPITVESNVLVHDAMLLMKKHNINQLIVMDKDFYVGMVHVHEIIKEGIV